MDQCMWRVWLQCRHHLAGLFLQLLLKIFVQGHCSTIVLVWQGWVESSGSAPGNAKMNNDVSLQSMTRAN